LLDARAQAFLIDQGIERLGAGNCAEIFANVFNRTVASVAPARGDVKAAVWRNPTEDIARCLALHMLALKEPVAGWQDAFVKALIARQIDRSTHSACTSFLAGIRALSATLEPQRLTPSPAFLGGVFRQVLQPALPAELGTRYAQRGTAQRLIAALVKEQASAHPSTSGPAPGERSFLFGSLMRGAARSPVELGEIIRNLVRDTLAQPTQDLTLLTVRDALGRMGHRFTLMQMAATGCGYALGLAGSGASARPWAEVAARVTQHGPAHPDVMRMWLALGMRVGASPVHALGRTDLPLAHRIDLVYLALDLARVLNRSEALALVLKLKIGDTPDMDSRQARLRAECMTRVVDASGAAVELSSLIEACAFTRRSLMRVVGDCARQRGIGAPDAKGDTQTAAGAFKTWLPGDFGLDAVHLYRLLCQLYDLANDRLSQPTMGVRAPFARSEREALADLPPRLRQPLLDRLKPIETGSGAADPMAPRAGHK
jgi:hypothetical protein